MKEMTLDIKVNKQLHQPVISIRTISNVKELPDVIAETYAKIGQYLAELDVEPVGPPFVAYFNLDMENLDVEIGFPVDDVLPGDHDMCPGEIPEGEVVSCLYRGPYEGMKEVYEAMNSFIGEKGYHAKGPAYEIYYNSPMDVKSPEELLTRIDLPVEKR